MEFIQCKNESEKLSAIAKYCNREINENNYHLNWYKSEQTSPLDYKDEIDELNKRNAHFKKILEIIEADELTSIMFY